MIWVQFAATALVIVLAGVRLAELARQTGLGEASVGSLFIAITTSLPEIVVSLTTVRIGALDLGIGNVLGSNLFNLLILGPLATAGPVIFLSLHRILSTAWVRDVLLGRGAVVQPL